MDEPADVRLRRLLADLAELRQTIQQLEHDIVHFAHEAGLSWERIGEAHDPPISRQRVRRRYDRPKPRRDRD